MTAANEPVRRRPRAGRRPVRGLARLGLALLAAWALPAACADPAPPVATPTLGVDRTSVPLGGPLALTIRFDIAPDLAPFADGFRVLLHFLDPDGALLWADDHDPPRPVAAWQPGERVEYERRTVVPMYPYIGEVTLALGLYAADTGERLALAGSEVGDRTYRVGTLTLEPQPETAFLAYGDGWYRSEISAGTSWRWTAGRAVVSFRNPRSDVALAMELDGRAGPAGEPQRVALTIDERPVHEFELQRQGPTIVRQHLSAADLGAEDIVELTLDVEPTFVPAERDPRATDTRELGVQVFYLFVEPR